MTDEPAAPPAPAFVAGATGYTGQAVVAALVAAGVPAVAHVRPDSPALPDWRRRFEALGARVDATPWEREALAARLRELEVGVVFALLGTTRHRAGREGLRPDEAYERVDYGLTALLIEAAAASGRSPRFVYLSSAGVEAATRNPYLQARVRAEAALRASGLPWTIARPSFITGDDRPEPRPLERLGARAGDAALALVGALGARSAAARYRSTDATTLAGALVRLALHPAAADRVVEGDALRSGDPADSPVAGRRTACSGG